MTRDELDFMSPGEAVRAAYLITSNLQDFRPAAQIAGVSILLNEMCAGMGIGVSEALNKAERMTKDADGFFTREVKALRDYIKGELT